MSSNLMQDQLLAIRDKVPVAEPGLTEAVEQVNMTIEVEGMNVIPLENKRHDNEVKVVFPASKKDTGSIPVSDLFAEERKSNSSHRKPNNGASSWSGDLNSITLSKEDIERLVKAKVDLTNAEVAEKKSSKFLTWAITAAFTVVGLSCLAMVGRNCMNSDDSPKFHL